MAAFDKDRLAGVFGSCVVHDVAKASATLWHSFGEEDFLRGHFPGFPVVPGVILLDGMILAALHAFERLTGRASSRIRKIAVDTVAFYRPVLPGMAAGFTARTDMFEAGNSFAAKCSVMVSGTRHARASIILHIQGDERSPVN